MRSINAPEIINAVKAMCIEANFNLPTDVVKQLEVMKENENSESAKGILKIIQENAEIARQERVPMCQDTGMVVVFIEIGQDVHISGGLLEDLVNEGIKQGYAEGFLRKSVVNDPIERVNTKDNTPAVIHYDLVLGDQLKITIAPKGFGSENMSQIKMLKPSEGIEGIKAFIIQTVETAGPNPCPPIILGIGIGGTFEKAALMSKKALMRDLGTEHEQSYYNNLEVDLLNEINALGIGPQGFGGKTTALGVHIETAPTHIAGLPVAVNIGCHAYRHVTRTL